MGGLIIANFDVGDLDRGSLATGVALLTEALNANDSGNLDRVGLAAIEGLNIRAIDQETFYVDASTLEGAQG